MSRQVCAAVCDDVKGREKFHGHKRNHGVGKSWRFIIIDLCFLLAVPKSHYPEKKKSWSSFSHQKHHFLHKKKSTSQISNKLGQVDIAVLFRLPIRCTIFSCVFCCFPFETSFQASLNSIQCTRRYYFYPKKKTRT